MAFHSSSSGASVRDSGRGASTWCDHSDTPPDTRRGSDPASTICAMVPALERRLLSGEFVPLLPTSIVPFSCFRSGVGAVLVRRSEGAALVLRDAGADTKPSEPPRLPEREAARRGAELERFRAGLARPRASPFCCGISVASCARHVTSASSALRLPREPPLLRRLNTTLPPSPSTVASTSFAPLSVLDVRDRGGRFCIGRPKSSTSGAAAAGPGWGERLFVASDCSRGLRGGDCVRSADAGCADSVGSLSGVLEDIEELAGAGEAL